MYIMSTLKIGETPFILSLLSLLLLYVSTSPVTGHKSLYHIYVNDVSGSDHNTGFDNVSPIRSLSKAVDLVANVIEKDQDANIIVNLSPGMHAVPRGGLRLGTKHSPPGGKVVWRGSNKKASSISGGIPITGWQNSTDKSLPAGVMVAKVPQQLKGSQIRHFYVNGMRCNRTRVSANGMSISNDSLSLLSFVNPEDIEFGWPGAAGAGWAEPRCTVSSIEPCTGCSGGSTKQCGADFNTTTPCCGQPGDPVTPEFQCPEDYPICTDYVFDHHYGHCVSTVPCGADYGNSTPCCGQGHGPVLKAMQCPKDLPTCIDYVYDSHFGHCIGGHNSSVKGVRMIMKQPCFWNLIHRPYQPIGTVPPTWRENVRSDLSSPGQFYYDKAANEILYIPLPDQDMTTASAIIPVEEVLVWHKSAQSQQWENVVFEYATWLRPMQNDGFVDWQSAVTMICPYGVVNDYGCGKEDVGYVTPGNVIVDAGKNILFSNCTFRHLGAYASSALNGSQGVVWSGCTFEDVSAGALMIGQVSTCNETDVTKWDSNFTVADNLIHNLPVEYTGATSIFVAYVQSANIIHNHIANTSYSGMTVGWGWGREGCGRGGNVVTGNIIENAMRARCCDGGLLYTLGPQPGSSITRNYLRNVPPVAGGRGQGIYHDNGSGGFTDSNNVIDGVFHDVCFLNVPLGPYGPGRKCPDAQGQQADCSVHFDNNWVRSTDKISCPANGTVTIPPTNQLPPEAMQIVNAAGPRN
eukprot:m.342867 g.342867  ORF g.342867 m.342867 type:complete len:745 (+) comp21934_c0_seq1:76-2310(+)